ncbi:MAG: GNAT family N-acetyltransferase [Shimia sp.]|uniref:GNAT family N-acetyltransferase n=1 Tax=Shimia sp. TaxID=1954381 RepID=UPI004059A2F3
MTDQRKGARPVGFVVPNWTPPPAPRGDILEGRYARLEPLDAEKHAALLFRAYQGEDAVWDYLPYGPFNSAAQYHRWMREAVSAQDPYFYAIYDKQAGAYGGVASYLRIKPEAGSIEVGNINFAPRLQGTVAATETMFLMMKWAFEAGYRRYEWKCDALNTPSRRAAQRLGLSYEGIFRQALVYKGRNRDTAWFATIDKEWAALREAFELWLSPGNFDAAGQQRERLSDLTGLVRAADDPTL